MPKKEYHYLSIEEAQEIMARAVPMHTFAVAGVKEPDGGAHCVMRLSWIDGEGEERDAVFGTTLEGARNVSFELAAAIETLARGKCASDEPKEVQ